MPETNFTTGERKRAATELAQAPPRKIAIRAIGKQRPDGTRAPSFSHDRRPIEHDAVLEVDHDIGEMLIKVGRAMLVT